ncbi:MAG: YgiT-type zinc finger protein [Nitrospirae bacterium]|nr:YgiT-type zinc finger protein [Nitrospirota bacterium]
MKKKKYDYGECEICNTPLEEKQIKQDFWIKGKLVVVEGVPAGVCPRCGEKVVKSDVGLWITKLIDDPRRLSKAPKISVPSVKYDPKEAAA